MSVAVGIVSRPPGPPRLIAARSVPAPRRRRMQRHGHQRGGAGAELAVDEFAFELESDEEEEMAKQSRRRPSEPIDSSGARAVTDDGVSYPGGMSYPTVELLATTRR